MNRKFKVPYNNTFNEIILYKTPQGKVKVEIFLHNENIWLTQKRMAELFGVGIPAVNKHLKNIFESGELEEDSVISILETTAEDGKIYPTKLNMGLTTWKNAPQGRIRKEDIAIAKNYLDEKELDQLNRIVTMYLDYAELQAINMRVMYMRDWVEKLDAFLKFNEKDILLDAAKVSHEVALALSEKEYEKYCVEQDKIIFQTSTKL